MSQPIPGTEEDANAVRVFYEENKSRFRDFGAAQLAYVSERRQTQIANSIARDQIQYQRQEQSAAVVSAGSEQEARLIRKYMESNRAKYGANYIAAAKDFRANNRYLYS